MQIIKYDIKSNYPLFLVVLFGISSAILMLCAFLGNGRTKIMNLLMMVLFNGGIGTVGALTYIIVTNSSLVSSMVDNGTIVNFLSTPTKKIKFTLYQTLYSILPLIIFNIITTLVIIIGLKMRGCDINIGSISMFGFGTFVFHFACAGICFLLSCIFNKSSLTMGISAGIFGYFIILNMAYSYGKDSVSFLKYLKYVNFISLYNIDDLLALSTDIWWKLLILVALGIISYIIGNLVFRKKDLFI